MSEPILPTPDDLCRDLAADLLTLAALPASTARVIAKAACRRALAAETECDALRSRLRKMTTPPPLTSASVQCAPWTPCPQPQESATLSSTPSIVEGVTTPLLPEGESS